MTSIKKFSYDTLLIVAAVCLIAGFVGGVAYGIYYASSSMPPLEATTEQPSQKLAAEIAALLEFTQNHPESADGWIRLGNHYFDAGRFKEAIEAYQKALALDSTNTDVWTDLGVMYRRVGQPEKAVEAFDKAIAADPSHEIARFNKGIVLMHDLDEVDAALESWRKLLQINPDATAPNGLSVRELIRQVENRPAG